LSKVPFVPQRLRPSKYETGPLEGAIRHTYSEKDSLFGWTHRINSQIEPQTKVAVISTSTIGTPIVISNYNRFCPEQGEPKIYGLEV
jgi:hypothetical protein